MPKFSSFTPKKLIKLLKRNSFIINNITGSHYGLYNKETGRRVVVAYHGKDVPKGTLNAIIKASGLDISLF